MAHEKTEDERAQEVMWKSIEASVEASDRQQSTRVFTVEDFKAAFQKLAERRRTASKIVLMGQTLAEAAGGPVRCGHCDDTCLVEALYDQRSEGSPCFEDCPAINEPWHVKR